MDLVEVDVVGLQLGQALVAGVEDVLADAHPLLAVAHGELGGDDHLVAPPLKRVADEGLAVPLAVADSRVEEVNA